MIRFVAIALGLALLFLVLVKLTKELKSANIDWRGVAFACGFVALAFYLRHATGMG
ncbi:hypothetical protein RB623_24570 [Mesorhizobium sp. LHD-90]|uniref:hypothetical protein n=1 Tax=Mesorhizobium sp. LHD-90 TaxID=3071414 RepID=UPI0027DFA65F|nr:hypothetical protein [Mesorhizobium sp. LHD-90]MDQ6437239.1 hypothetical protein [Mesorhizobium sp. LHD-90]